MRHVNIVYNLPEGRCADGLAGLFADSAGQRVCSLPLVGLVAKGQGPWALPLSGGTIFDGAYWKYAIGIEKFKFIGRPTSECGI